MFTWCILALQTGQGKRILTWNTWWLVAEAVTWFQTSGVVQVGMLIWSWRRPWQHSEAQFTLQR